MGGTGGFCVALVAAPPSGSGALLHDLVIGLPTLSFLVFLGWRLRSSVRKLQRSQSHIMTTYYVFLWVISALNLLRCAVQLGQAQLANNALWNGFLLLARFGAILLEVSVVVFLLQGYLVSGREALFRTLWISGTYAAVETLAAAFWIFKGHVSLLLYSRGDVSGEGSADMTWSKWSFFLVHSTLFVLVYLGILVLPYTKWRDRLPAKPSFYHYVMVLFVLNVLAAVGSTMLGSGVSAGYCVYGISSFAYYALYPPLLYFTFLAEFFQDAEMDLDLMYYSEMRDAGYFDDQDYDQY